MAMSEPHTPAPEPKFGIDPLAAVLSYLIPGLGQIYQGRLLKGVLFLVCLLGLFFYGLSLGKGQNVYFPPLKDKNGQIIPNHGDLWIQSPVVVNMVGQKIRIPHVPFLAQFWIGIAAWPAIYQAATYDVSKLEPNHGIADYNPADKERTSWWSKLERYPPLSQQETMLRDGDKSGDLGWVYTIIAGLLNLLVIYDALAGPAHGNQSVPITTFLIFLLVLTGTCLIAYGAWAFMLATGRLGPTLYVQLPAVLVLVSLVYSATRFERWQPIVLEAVHWGWRMTAFLLAIGAALYVVARPSLLAFAGW